MFPELVRRIIHCDITHIDDVNTKDKDDSSTVTLFQLNEYFTSALELDGCDVTIAKLIDLLSYERKYLSFYIIFFKVNWNILVKSLKYL